MTPPMQSSGSPLYMFARTLRIGSSCNTDVGRPRETRNIAPFLFIETAPPVLVSLYGNDTFPSLSIFITSLLVFCAARIPPSFVAMMPSALFPVPVQTDFHCCPAAITPGIKSTLYSLFSGGPAAALFGPRASPPRPAAGAAAAPAPRPPPPPRWGGGTLHFAIASAYLASCGAWTPGPCCGAGAWPNTTMAPRQPAAVRKILFEFIAAPYCQMS